RPTYDAYCGTGYESMARLAAGNPELWRDILISNREAVCRVIDVFEQTCRKLRNALIQNDLDTVTCFLENAKKAV
ncbi:MAG: prephenate dehydrogenase/arogenate dehydrogenase family protein, partial [Planctomycetaceae bacterium]|nr:prephenate dehydrogenase/arogenate dehydrogenase family protein [Planctomycetaceae bacterium]